MIYVIRHGQTDLNKEGKLQGRQSLPKPLNAKRYKKGMRTKNRVLRS